MKQALRIGKSNQHGIMQVVFSTLESLNQDNINPDTLEDMPGVRFALINGFSISNGYIGIVDTANSNTYGIEVFSSKTGEFVAVASMYRDEDDQEFIGTEGTVYTAADLY